MLDNLWMICNIFIPTYSLLWPESSGALLHVILYIYQATCLLLRSRTLPHFALVPIFIGARYLPTLHYILVQRTSILGSSLTRQRNFLDSALTHKNFQLRQSTILPPFNINSSVFTVIFGWWADFDIFWVTSCRSDALSELMEGAS